jgi:hypothetical protein
MDTLAKQKLIDTRDFLVELLISKTIGTYNIADNVKLYRLIHNGLVTWQADIKRQAEIELTKKGHAFINEHKDLV